MRAPSDREAWIRIRHEDEIPPDAPNNYNFGFRAAMGRQQATTRPLAGPSVPCFGKSCSNPAI